MATTRCNTTLLYENDVSAAGCDADLLAANGEKKMAATCCIASLLAAGERKESDRCVMRRRLACCK
jgi:hypothetical protein